ncbi:MAG: hypothetical protein IH845_02165 [Nanoarchaeota archaeon]|nr:hypothetical protein [Nanoarchaeota archaeon]
MDTKEIQKKQDEYDKKYWQHNSPESEKIRHITLHIGKLLGKLSTYCEKIEHGEEQSKIQIKEEIIPDLIFYSAQLSNLLNIEDMGKSYLKRLENNINKFQNR